MGFKKTCFDLQEKPRIAEQIARVSAVSFMLSQKGVRFCSENTSKTKTHKLGVKLTSLLIELMADRKLPAILSAEQTVMFEAPGK